MNLRVLASLSAIVTSQLLAEHHAPIDEQWVLAEDKSAFLKTLTPGTDNYFFFHALQQQKNGDTAAFLRTMENWKAVYKHDSARPSRATQLLNRQTLLDYEAGDPHATQDLLALFDIANPAVAKTLPNASEESPSTLDQSLISDQAFFAKLVEEQPTKILSHTTKKKWLSLLNEDRKWNKQDRDRLLRNITRADIKGIEKLIDANFRGERPLTIKQVACAGNLSLTQLKTLSNAHPKLLRDAHFVHLWIRAIMPAEASQFTRHPEKQLAWLAKLDKFTHKLPSHYNSLKAHVLYHRLRLSAAQDNYPQELFVRYLQLPRAHSPMWKKSNPKRSLISLNSSFSQWTSCPPIGDDSQLIESYLDQLLANEGPQSTLANFFDADYFKRRVTIAQLLSGVSPQNTLTQLEATDFETLRDLRELNIAPSSKISWQKESLVKLHLDIKNIETLTVSIYALDSLRYAKETGREVSNSLDLSSLVANSTRSIDFTEDKFLRHRKVLELPELTDVGSWVVEIHGNGQRCSALIHKGEIHHAVRDTGNGQEVLVTNYQGEPLKDVEVTVAGKDYQSDTQGIVSIPYSPYVSQSDMRLHLPSKDRKNGITRIVKLQRRKPNTSLHLATIAHPEQWIPDNISSLHFKPNFLVNGLSGSLERIESSKVSINGTLSDGQQVELARAPIKISSHDYLKESFTVPHNLQKITIEVTSTLKPIAGREKLTIKASSTIEAASSQTGEALAHHYFYQSNNEWFLQCQGRNGEAWPAKQVKLAIEHSRYTRPLQFQCTTNPEGIIALGALRDISSVTIAASSDSPSASLNLRRKSKPLPLDAFVRQEDKLAFHLSDTHKLTPELFSLVSTQGEKIDHFDKLDLNGTQLSIGTLPVGQYLLEVPGFYPHTFDIIQANVNGQWLTATGSALEANLHKTPQISEVRRSPKQLEIQLSDTTTTARLHLIASHYSSDGSPYHPSGTPAPSQVKFNFGFTPSVYKNGGTLSSEHQYILNRRAEGFKLGNMLEKPAWHTLPWRTESSTSYTHELEEGFGAGGGAGKLGRASKRRPRKSSVDNSANNTSPVNFIAQPARVITNLTPDKNGRYTFNLDKLDGFQRVDIILTQGRHVDSKQLDLGNPSIQKADLRLAKSLNTDVHYRASETIAVLREGASAKIENVVDAEWKAYSTLEDVYSYYHTHASNDIDRQRLQELSPILIWPKLDQEDRLKLLRTSGCHELLIFIQRRDPEWFKAHIQPTLTHKRRKTFIDHYLLGNDLKGYLKPSAFHQLNTIEQALLARHFGHAAIIEKLDAEYQANKPDTETASALFSSLLKQGFETDLDETKLGLARSGSALYLRNKLKHIVLPVVDFENVTVDQALDILRQRTRELDSLELDPAKKGVSYVVRTPTVTGYSAESDEFGGALNSGQKIIKSLKLRNVPLEVVIQQICDVTMLRYKVEDACVVFLPATDFDDTEMYTRSFDVPPDFVTLLNTGAGGGSDDPFADDGSAGAAGIGATPPIKDLLAESGIVFPEGAAVSYSRATGKLTVRNTANNLDIVDQLTDTVGSSPSRGIREDRISIRTKQVNGKLAEAEASEVVGAASDDLFAEDGDMGIQPRQDFVDKNFVRNEAEAYIESNYFKHPWTHGKLEIHSNRFWIDLAKAEKDAPFLSPHFAECKDSLHEALLALAFLDLPFESVKPNVALQNNSMEITANNAMLLYYRDLRATQDKGEQLLTSVRYFRRGDLFSTDASGRKRENTITGDFQTLTPYEAHLIVTNPTGIVREVDILRQIPAGAIPLGNADTLRALRTELAPHQSWKHVIPFYFPEAGKWSHYPPQIHEGKTLVSNLKSQTLNVRNDLQVEIGDTWLKLVHEGSDADLLQAIKSNPLHTIQLEPLEHRMSQPEFYEKAMPLLKARMVEPWHFIGQSVTMHDHATVADFLADARFCSNHFGAYFKTSLCDKNPYNARSFEDTEWRPLINTRRYDLVDENRISNEKVWTDYLTLMRQLVWLDKLGDEEKLTLAYHLFLHERNEEAITIIATCSRDACASKMQFDYLQSYIHFLRSQPEKAKVLAARWVDVANAPWKQRFEEVIKQAEEISKSTLLVASNDDLAGSRFWSANLKKDNTLQIEHSGIEDIVVQVYPVDLEFLFSSSPFLQSNNANYKAIRPLQELKVTLPKDKKLTEVTLPDSYQAGDRLLVIDDGEKEWLQPVQSTMLEATFQKRNGVLQAQSENKPVPRCYVKVYAYLDNGETVFFKDGHTDLRGMFDYQSHNQHTPGSVRSYALFITHPKLGSITRQLGESPPKDKLLPEL